MKHFLDIPDGEYELIRLDESGHWVVRDAGGDVLTEEQDSPLKIAEVRCDFCERWTANAAPFATDRWMCFGGADPCPGARGGRSPLADQA